MKESLIKIIMCPKCHNKFKITKSTIKNNEIHEGELECTGCHSTYPIINYVPRLVKKFNYSSSWGELWKETGHLLRDSFTGQPWHYDVIHGKYNEEGKGIKGTSPFGFEWPKKMKGELILEIGPGTGNSTEHLVNTDATIFAVDMSDAIDTFPEELMTRKNLHVIQADITEGTIPSDYFDRIWFFQVLQHTPSPPETLKNVRQYLKKGGELAVTSYKGHFNPWYYFITKRIDSKLSWKLISFWCPILVPVKYRLQKFFFALKLDIIAKGIRKIMEPVDSRNIYFNTLEGKANDYLYAIMWNKNKDKKLLMKYVIINTFDTITPEYTNCCPNNQVMDQWLKDAGYSSFKTWGVAGVRAKAIK